MAFAWSSQPITELRRATGSSLLLRSTMWPNGSVQLVGGKWEGMGVFGNGGKAGAAASWSAPSHGALKGGGLAA